MNDIGNDLQNWYLHEKRNFFPFFLPNEILFFKKEREKKIRNKKGTHIDWTGKKKVLKKLENKNEERIKKRKRRLKGQKIETQR